MNTSSNDIASVLKRNGSSQLNRYREQLDPDQLELMGMRTEDWILFAMDFAKKIHFYSTQNKPETDWSDFFKELHAENNPTGTPDLERAKKAIQELLSSFESKGNLSPQLTLFVSFLKLLELSRSRFNALTKRHLDFYYQKILQLNKQSPSPDHVYVLLELAKNAPNYLLKESTIFPAGKNNDGQPLVYTNPRELTVNPIQIKSILQLYHDDTLKKVKQALLLDPEKGPADPLKKGTGFWPFGQASEPDPMLQDACFGFVLNSKELLLQEGSRKISFEFTFGSSIPWDAPTLRQYLDLSLSTEKSWLELDETQLKWENIQISDQTLKILVELDPTDPSIAPFATNSSDDNALPAARFLIRMDAPAGYKVFTFLSKTPIEQVHISVEAMGVKNILLENDQSSINSQKPFYPFTTRPFRGSSFSFSYPEAFSKNCKELTLQFQWKNTPGNFKNHYESYLKEAFQSISSNFIHLHQEALYLEKIEKLHQEGKLELLQKGKLELLQKGKLEWRESAEKSDAKKETPRIRKRPRPAPTSGTTGQPIVTGDAYFQFKSEFFQNGLKLKSLNHDNTQLFSKTEDGFSFDLTLANQLDPLPDSKVRISLLQSFLHELYPKIYAMILTAEAEDKILPNEPYTPLASDISLSYSAESTWTQEEIMDKITQLEPFGQSPMTGMNLISNQYASGGHLYIGLDRAQPLDQFAILFQLEEGSENPLAVTENPIEWGILKNNHWEDLPKKATHLNETKNFLSSGIIKIQLPDSLDQKNSRLPAGLTWIRAKLTGPHNSVCRCLGIHAHALKVIATDPSLATHLPEPLPPKSISKLSPRIAAIKSVSQPYPGFGGKRREEDLNYYRRVSERLRHKNRSISQWDYEQLILEKFPELILVKCLNHTSPSCFNAPGHVSIIVVPQTSQSNPGTLTYPRVSAAKLKEIQAYITRYTSPQVEVHVINPDYEQLQVQVDVSLTEGLDFTVYQSILIQDLTNFISPWMTEESTLLNFNKEFHKSQFLFFIENLPYISSISRLELLLNANPVSHRVSPSSPRNIIVSDQTHLVNLSVSPCLT